MTPPLLWLIAWILAVSVVGFLPSRFHKRFGFPLLVLFVPLLIYVGWSLGLAWAVGVFVAGLSIYRYPARYYGRLLLGKLRA